MLKFVPIKLRDFKRDTSATITVEMLFIIPVLALWFVASYVFFDSFRNQNTTVKAASTISDILSRRTVAVTDDYVDGLGQLYDRLVAGPTTGASFLRISSITQTAGVKTVVWSEASSTSNLAPLKSDLFNLPLFQDRMPDMYDGQYVVLVETYTNYTPAFDVGVLPKVWENFVVTSMRDVDKLSHEDHPGV